MPDMNRRQALTLTGGAALVALARPSFAQNADAAQTSSAGVTLEQAPGYQRFAVGDATVTGLADGTFKLTAELMPTLDEAAFERAMRDAFLNVEGGAYAAPVNAFLVQRGGRTVLIDAGGSPRFQPTMGALDEQLEAAGVAAADVDAVLMTHLHPDHTGGLIGPTGAAFPNAELVVREEEIAFWTDPATRAALPEPMRPLVDALNATLALYEGRIVRSSGDAEVAPGITPVHLPGHTPGHTGYRIADDGEQLLIWGDVIHAAAIQFAEPRAFVAYDSDPETAVATRLRVLDEVATDRVRVAGMHMPFPGLGHVVREGAGYRLVQSEWEYRG